MHTYRTPMALVLAVCLMLFSASLASAHQPFFEDKDFTAKAPGTVKDPTVSTALYATLESPRDVDYVTFEGKRGDSILIGLTIPAIDGQENFTPTVAIMGPGLPKVGVAQLPHRVAAPADSNPPAGAITWRAAPEKPGVFFEPFSRTKYWERQENRIKLPTDGRYTVAIWSDNCAVGRYTLVVGEREVLGGDPAFPVKLPAYWQPVQPTPQPTSQPTSKPHQGCDRG
jgi:hypothetical protein